MKNYYFLFALLVTLLFFFSFKTIALDGSSESTRLATSEPSTAKTFEATSSSTPEITGIKTVEATAAASAETRPAMAEVSTAEGASYKGSPWGVDFNAFKSAKNFVGYLSQPSAAFVGSADDNDIAMLLGVPVSAKDSNGEQRVMFEYVPRKFAFVYFEPDDTYYIFYDGKFAMAFSKINSKNFDLYRDTFYKKYKKDGGFSKKYELTAKKSSLLQASIFGKGKTVAFLIKQQLTDRKSVFISTKILFAADELLGAIRKEINDKLAAEKMTSGEKSKQELEKDLNKIE